MQGVVSWLQTNNGAVTAVATVVLTATTIVYAVLTGVLAKENKRLRKAGTEPSVVCYLIPDHRYRNMIQFVVANVGKGVALDLRISLVHDPEDFKRHNVMASFRADVPLVSALPQDEKIVSFFGAAYDLLAPNPTPLALFTAVANYRDTSGIWHTQRFEMSISGFEGLGAIGKPSDLEMAEQLKKIATSLNKISTELPKLSAPPRRPRA